MPKGFEKGLTVPAVGIYESVDDLLRSRAGGSPAFGQLLAPQPQVLSPRQWQVREKQFDTLRFFFDVTLELFKASLRHDVDPAIARLLLNDTPIPFGYDYHRGLADSLLTRPLFFRTDEAPDGTIYEIQCPGSGWGEYELLRDLYQAFGLNGQLDRSFPPSLSDGFVEEVESLGLASTPVLYLVDNSSSPAGVRYFIERTRPRLRYYGWDAGVRSLDCGLIRSHSFIGLMAENFAARRVAAATETGTPRFDLPPHVLFDQKLPLVLPFWSATRDSYPDAVRTMLPYTQIITADGFELPDGSRISLEEFSSLPKQSRRCFIKYAGTDVAWNWGSHAVSRLSKASSAGALAELQNAARATASGHPWVVQFEHADAETVEWIDSVSGELLSGVLTAKYSAFYGPRGLLGMSTWYRNEPKVHSQSDAVQRICGVATAS